MDDRLVSTAPFGCPCFLRLLALPSYRCPTQCLYIAFDDCIIVLTGLHGSTVVITGRRKEVLDGAVRQLQALGITAAGLQGDVRSYDTCKDWVNTTVDTFGGLNILVNCAAGNFLANAAELSQGGFKTGWFLQCLSLHVGIVPSCDAQVPGRQSSEVSGMI